VKRGKKKGRILVVDDEVNARTALAELLRDEGYEVETAADAFKALGKCDGALPQVVMTDLKMPEMDGIELIRKLRSLADPPAVVVMTAFGAIDSAVDAIRAGAQEYLTKPIHFDELLLTVERAMENRTIGVASASSGVVRSDGDVVEASHLPSSVRPVAGVIQSSPLIPGATLAEIERYAIIETLKATGGSTSRAAEILGISVRTIQYRLHQYQAAPRSDVMAVTRGDSQPERDSGNDDPA
jgi:DNA-binding NtrC family response regulator